MRMTLVLGFQSIRIFHPNIFLTYGKKTDNNFVQTSSPNPGFVRQLKLFEAMQCTVDYEHPLYRRLLMEIERRRKSFRDV
jgi:hypothetical protein